MRVDRIALITEMAKQEVSVAQLAEKTGLSRGTITAIRSGKSCSSKSATLVAQALRTDIDKLVRPNRNETEDHIT